MGYYRAPLRGWWSELLAAEQRAGVAHSASYGLTVSKTHKLRQERQKWALFTFFLSSRPGLELFFDRVSHGWALWATIIHHSVAEINRARHLALEFKGDKYYGTYLHSFANAYHF